MLHTFCVTNDLAAEQKRHAIVLQTFYMFLTCLFLAWIFCYCSKENFSAENILSLESSNLGEVTKFSLCRVVFNIFDLVICYLD